MAVDLPKDSEFVFFRYEFPVSRKAWHRLGFTTLEAAGAASLSRAARRLHAMRRLADRLNAEKDTETRQTHPARSGELLALALLNEVMRHVADLYCVDTFPGVLQRGLHHTLDRGGWLVGEQPLGAYIEHFPPEPLLLEGDTQAFIAGNTGRLSNREVAARESLLLRLNNLNRAAWPYRSLFDDEDLQRQCQYLGLVKHLENWFDTQPPVPHFDLPLHKLLRAPIEACPDSLEGQLEYIRVHWRGVLPAELLELLEVARSVMQEETRMRGLGPGPTEALRFGAGAGGGSYADEDYGLDEPEAFSVDKEWMPNVVLLAKTIYVWLHQLSRHYQRDIQRLDQIPEEELDKLARWGVTGLWLIGLWERSPASRDIKVRMGNPEAAASAYSLYDYNVSEDLGGYEAYETLNARAWLRGIRLASDMVPNHFGIYSRWVIEHPDWFVQLPYPPYPAYNFNGPNLSSDPRVTLHLEDGYWNHSDAAVVFRRVDTWSGDTRYIYHGNDGTSMPWNDTAQLNFLLPEVREAVLQTILHVARHFRIIRFDAAMTLAKQHFQRLWYPKPGDGGAIPSRAEHGMSKAEFDRHFPVEFWREVVDRVAKEVPDTLLLAEAFWLMEGYFVRTLGMHRVYNSAFMNMLKMEENAKYRQTLKNVLEFSPEILQRFVNFMNNPDEDTAEAQFGRGDKYFGVAIMLVTMPGLPMLGHGQVEGYSEKYGMEYRRAYRDEEVDWGLVHRHEHEIFPLMRKRYLFSGALHFALYDFVTPDGWVDENVFAYSNRHGNERALIIYNNAYNTTRGAVYSSTAINEGSSEHVVLRRRSLVEALAIKDQPQVYYVFRDHRTGLEYLRHGPRIASDGLYVELTAYQYQAFMDWREVLDLDASWERLDAFLGGQGVPSMDESYAELHLAPILDPFRDVVNEATLRLLSHPEPEDKDLDSFHEKLRLLLEALGERMGKSPDTDLIIARVDRDLKALHELGVGEVHLTGPGEMVGGLEKPSNGSLPSPWRVALVWGIVRHLGAAALEGKDLRANGHTNDIAATGAAWLHEWFLRRQIARAFEELDGDAWRADMDARLVRICVAHGRHLLALHKEIWAPILEVFFGDPDVQQYLQINRHRGRRWINQERLEEMLQLLYLTLATSLLQEDEDVEEQLVDCHGNTQALLDAARDTGYDLDDMFNCLK